MDGSEKAGSDLDAGAVDSAIQSLWENSGRPNRKPDTGPVDSVRLVWAKRPGEPPVDSTCHSSLGRDRPGTRPIATVDRLARRVGSNRLNGVISARFVEAEQEQEQPGLASTALFVSVTAAGLVHARRARVQRHTDKRIQVVLN